ncbi:MAG: cobalamin-dependent protein [Pseudomonadota bacterium]
MDDILGEIADKLESCDREKLLEVLEDVKKALAQGLKPNRILENGLLEGLGRVGAKFKTGDVFIPEVLIVAKAVHQSMDIMKPFMVQGEIKPRGRIVLGTVKGDLHDIGKNLVGIMLESAGFEIIDIGINTPAEKFLQAVKENKADIVGISALLTTTMNEMKTVIDLFKSEGINTKIIVGGAPITQEFAGRIGADAYAADAGEAVEKVSSLLA